MNSIPMTARPFVRRPIRARHSQWAINLARWLPSLGLRPNQVSILSLVFSVMGGVCLLAFGRLDQPWRILLPAGAIVCISLRGLCNLMDGMMAVEGGLRGKSGDVFNELPDRFSDTVRLVGLGYAAGWSGAGPLLGWSASVLALITAYVRVLGVQAGASAQFCGPMAKSARMGVVVAACLGMMIETALHLPVRTAGVALVVVAIGGFITIARRTRRIIRELEAQ
mgnify:CR=1 FL=1